MRTDIIVFLPHRNLIRTVELINAFMKVTVVYCVSKVSFKDVKQGRYVWWNLRQNRHRGLPHCLHKFKTTGRCFLENIHYVFESDPWQASDWNPWSPCWLGEDFPLFFPPHSSCAWCPRGLCNGEVLCLLWGRIRIFNSEEFRACSKSFPGALYRLINSLFSSNSEMSDIFRSV
jgi:hypothetical protein